RRRQVVAADPDRDSQSWGTGYFGCLRGWIERISGSDCDRLSAHGGAVVYRAHGAQQPGLRELERAQASGRRSAAYLPGTHSGSGRSGIGSLRRVLDGQVCGDWKAVAAALDRHQPAVCLSGRDPEGDLYDQRSGIAAHDIAENDQNAGFVSERRSGAEAAVSSSAKRSTTLAACPELAHVAQPFSAAVGRPDRGRRAKGWPLRNRPPRLRRSGPSLNKV